MCTAATKILPFLSPLASSLVCSPSQTTHTPPSNLPFPTYLFWLGLGDLLSVVLSLQQFVLMAPTHITVVQLLHQLLGFMVADCKTCHHKAPIGLGH